MLSFVLTLFLISIFLRSTATKEIRTAVCQTPACNNLSVFFKSLIDESVDPCDNFHRFACGTFLKTAKIPADSISAGPTTSKVQQIEQQVIELLTADINANDPDFVNLPKIYYQTCTQNSNVLNKVMLKRYIEFSGGWPLLEGAKWNEKPGNWVEIIKLLQLHGFQSNQIFSVDIQLNVTDIKSKKRWISIIDGSNSFFKMSSLHLYYDMITATAVELGAVNDHKLKTSISRLVGFEYSLAQIFNRTDLSKSTWTTIKKLQESYKYFPWLEHIQNLMPDGLSIDENELIAVAPNELFESIGKLMRHTPERVIADYLMWRALIPYLPFLSERMENMYRDYRTTTTTSKDPSLRRGSITRNSYCINEVLLKKPLNVFVGHLYVKKHYNKKYSIVTSEIITNIRIELFRALKQSTWMDADTKAHALKKLKWISQLYIGYREEFLNETLLATVAIGLQFHPNNYVINSLQLNKFNAYLEYSELKYPTDADYWLDQFSPAIYNAYYNPSSNSINFPAAYLASNIYPNGDVPNYINYGLVGTTVGHELLHAFDSKGSQYDWIGNLNNWWSEGSEVIFEDKSQCVIDQYGNMTESTTHRPINGIATLGENIADIEGYQFTYNAYKRLNGGNEPILPNLKYNARQLFWIATAAGNCDVYTIDAMQSLLDADVHSPGEMRILGTIKNSKAFARDFHCKEGTPMNPVKKCDIW